MKNIALAFFAIVLFFVTLWISQVVDLPSPILAILFTASIILFISSIKAIAKKNS